MLRGEQVYGVGEPDGGNRGGSRGGSEGQGKLVGCVSALAALVAALAASLTFLYGDGGVFSQTPQGMQPPAAEASPPLPTESASASGEPSSDPYTDAERRLGRRVMHPDREYSLECGPGRGGDHVQGALATLRCHPPELDVPVEAVAVSFATEAELATFIDGKVAYGQPGPQVQIGHDGNYICPYEGTWPNHEGISIGPYVCYFDGSDYVAIWGFTNDAYYGEFGEVFAVEVRSDDPLALGDWWDKTPV